MCEWALVSHTVSDKAVLFGWICGAFGGPGGRAAVGLRPASGRAVGVTEAGATAFHAERNSGQVHGLPLYSHDDNLEVSAEIHLN